MDHYEHPRNRGALPDAAIVASGGGPGCGHALTMYAQVDAHGRIECAAFEGEGCTIALAAASYVTEMVQGMSLAEVDDLPFETLFDQLGRDILQTRPQCATLTLGALKQGSTPTACARPCSRCRAHLPPHQPLVTQQPTHPGCCLASPRRGGC